MKILLADDDEVSRVLLQFQLEEWGHCVVPAVDGAQAWELFGNSRLLHALASTSDAAVDTALPEIVNHVNEWIGDAPIRDDLSLLVLEFSPHRAALCGHKGRIARLWKSNLLAQASR